MIDSDLTPEILEEKVFEDIRKHARQKYKKILNEYKDLDMDIDTKKLSNELEEGTYNYSLERIEDTTDYNEETVPYHELKTVYKQIFVKTICNMSVNENKKYVIEKIINEKWPVKNIPKIHREVLFPEKWDKFYKDRSEDKKKKKKGAHRCPKCKSWYTDYAEAQTRSADEACSIFCNCSNCGNRWKFS